MRLEMTINGSEAIVDIEPQDMLLDVLRTHLGLLGTKAGCREGECGSCTILLDGSPVVSCILPAAKAAGKHIVTIEGIGTIEDPHPIQVSMASMGATQCGYCTPGFIVSAYALMKENPKPTIQEVKEAIAGNLCRCTGYTKIIEAISTTTKESQTLPE